MALPQRSNRGPRFRSRKAAVLARRPRGRSRGSSFANVGGPGLFKPNVKLDTSQVRDMRTARGSTMQLQQRRAHSRRAFKIR